MDRTTKSPAIERPLVRERTVNITPNQRESGVSMHVAQSCCQESCLFERAYDLGRESRLADYFLFHYDDK